MSTRPSIQFGQNFLRRASVAEKIVDLAQPRPSDLCVDLGAGNGIITKAALASGHRILAVEIDDRLAGNLNQRFGDNDSFELVHDDLTSAKIPPCPFSIVANPPFNQSTAIFRRWVLDSNFHSGAILAQDAFGKKIAGHYGATKLSLAVAPFRNIDIPEIVSSNFFRPRPKVPVVIVRVIAIDKPELSWSERQDYWLFINYLFERGQRTIGEVLKPLRLSGIPRRFQHLPIRELTTEAAIELFTTSISQPRVQNRLHSFDRGLTDSRRLSLGDDRGTKTGTNKRRKS